MRKSCSQWKLPYELLDCLCFFSSRQFGRTPDIPFFMLEIKNILNFFLHDKINHLEINKTIHIKQHDSTSHTKVMGSTKILRLNSFSILCSNYCVCSKSTLIVNCSNELHDRQIWQNSHVICSLLFYFKSKNHIPSE